MDPTEEPHEEMENEPQQEIEETPTQKRRGRPNGSKNKAPDIYTALLDRMTQMEETFKNRESTVAPETPIRMKRPRQPKVQIEAPVVQKVQTPTELLMESLYQTGEARRRKQLDFYQSFLP
jgi:hypothetical protein